MLEPARALDAGGPWRGALQRALEVVREGLGALSAVAALPEPEGRGLRLEAAAGLSASAASKVRYAPGEGITGRVAQSGRPVVVPQASREPLFLDRAGLGRAAS